MSTASESSERREDKTWRIVQDVLERRNRGEVVLTDEVLRQHPAHAEQINLFLQRADRISAARTYSSEPVEAAQESFERKGFPRSFGNYELLELISRGGMGKVFRANQKGTNREVALKVIRDQELASSESIERFRKESESMAALRHPHIVTVYEVGQVGDQHFYSMEFIRGESLDETISRAPVSGAVAVEILLPVVDAVATAHRHGVVHRDLKPSNIILDADGRPHITDFGLAKHLSDDSAITQTGQVIGSAAYMAPEQAMGKHELVDERSDVYGLGATLYEMLTRRAPFSAESVPLTLLQVVKEPPTPPRTLNSNISRDIETICLKCLDKKPRRRYQSVQELRDDIVRWQQRKPIKAAPPSLAGRFVRWVQRDPRLATAVGIAALFFVSLIAALLWGLNQSRAEKYKAERSLYLTHMNLAQRAWTNGNVNYVARILNRYREPATDFRGFEWHYLGRISNQSASIIQADEVWRTSDISPDMKSMLVGSRSGQVYLYDLRTKSPVWKKEISDDLVRNVEFDSTGKRFVTCCDDGSVSLWDAATGGQILHFAGHVDSKRPEVNQTAFIPNMGRIVSVGRDQTIREWDIATGEQLPLRFEGHSDHINHVEYCKSKNQLISCSRSREVFVWDYETGEMLDSLLDRQNGAGAIGPVAALASSLHLPEYEQLVTGDQEGRIAFWDANSFQNLKRIKPHKAAVNSFSLSRDGSTLVAASSDGSISLIELPSWNVLQTLRGHSRAVVGVEFISDDRFVSVGEGGEIHWWNAELNLDEELDGHAETVWDLAVSSDGKKLASCGSDGRVVVRELESGDTICEMAHPAEVNGVAFSNDGKLLATACDDCVVRVIDARTAEVVTEHQEHEDNVGNVCFVPGTQIVVSTGRDGTAQIWDVANKQSLGSIKVQERGVLQCCVSLDGRYLFTAGDDPIVRKWKLATREFMASGKLHTDQVRTLNISFDGTKLVSAGRDGKAIVWNAADFQALLSLDADIIQVKAACFSPDGQAVVTAGDDKNVKLWDLETGDQRAMYASDDDRKVSSVVFTPDGNTLISGTEGQQSKIVLRHAAAQTR